MLLKVLLCIVDMDGLFFNPLVPFTAVPSLIPFVAILCGLRGLVFADDSRLGLRECWTPWTMEVWRWWPYSEGLRSISKLCFERPCAPGVTPLGDAF